jgi:Skp family chaperone for outer membrane proteins
MPRLSLSACLLASALLVAPCAAPAIAQPTPVAIAVVDMLSLMNDFPGFKRAKDALETTAKQVQSEFELAKKEIDTLETELKVKVPLNAPNRTAMEKTIATKKMQSKFDLEWRLRVAQDEHMTTLIRVHSDVSALVGKYARENGYGLVLQMTREPVTGRTPDELIPNIIVRSVVYHDPALDITAAVKATFPK